METIEQLDGLLAQKTQALFELEDLGNPDTEEENRIQKEIDEIKIRYEKLTCRAHSDNPHSSFTMSSHDHGHGHGHGHSPYYVPSFSSSSASEQLHLHPQWPRPLQNATNQQYAYPYLPLPNPQNVSNRKRRMSNNSLFEGRDDDQISKRMWGTSHGYEDVYQPQRQRDGPAQDQLSRDEELARQLEDEYNADYKTLRLAENARLLKEDEEYARRIDEEERFRDQQEQESRALYRESREPSTQHHPQQPQGNQDEQPSVEEHDAESEDFEILEVEDDLTDDRPLSLWPQNNDILPQGDAGGMFNRVEGSDDYTDDAGNENVNPWYLHSDAHRRVQQFLDSWGYAPFPKINLPPFDMADLDNSNDSENSFILVSPLDFNTPFIQDEADAFNFTVSPPLPAIEPQVEEPVVQDQPINNNLDLTVNQDPLPRVGNQFTPFAPLLNRAMNWPAALPAPVSQYADYLRSDPTKTMDEIRALLGNIRPDMDIPPENREGTPEALVYPLMEHQKLGLAWMKAMEEGSNKGGILADDMGLGKTIQALALIVARPSLNKKCKTTLIVAPLSLLKQWEREIQKKLKQNYALTVYIHHGTAKRYKTFKELTKFDVVLTTFGTIATEYRRKLAAIEMIKTQPEVVLNEDDYLFTGKTSVWYRVIIDEAQCIKNRETLGARGCAELTATYRFCLSGTPMQNRCDEIYSLIRFLRIKPYSDWTNFNRDFSKPFKSKSSSDHGVRDSMRKFQALLKAFLLRRTKASQIDGKPILTLPPKTIEVVHSVFSSEEQNFYNALQSKTLIQFNKYLRANSIGKNYSNILVLLLRMRQACCHPHLINDIEVNGEVSEDAMEVLAKDLPPAAVTRLKESGIEECPICMDTSNNPSIVLPCGHGFCNDCIVQVYNTATQQGLARGDENAGARCPGCRGNLDIKKIIDWNTFQKVYLKEAKEDNGTPEASKKNGLNADALAKLRRDARRNAASKRQYIEYLEDNWMPSAKITKCLEILERVHTNDPSEKTIIFSQWTSLLDLLEVPIFRKNWGYRRYDGTMTSTERNDAIIDFTDDPSVNVMLVSLKAGNSGLNLVAASQVILFDPCYNPYVEDQAIDRAHRIGQQRPVVVHKLSIKGTVEDKVLALQEEKKAVIGSALDENASKGIARLGARDLAFLFGIDGAQLARMG